MIAAVRHQRTKLSLAIHQRHIPQVFTVEPQQVEGDEERFAMPVKKIAELWLAPAIETNNLAIEHSGTRTQCARKRIIQSREGFEVIPVARYQPASTIV